MPPSCSYIVCRNCSTLSFSTNNSASSSHPRLSWPSLTRLPSQSPSSLPLLRLPLPQDHKSQRLPCKRHQLENRSRRRLQSRKGRRRYRQARSLHRRRPDFGCADTGLGAAACTWGCCGQPPPLSLCLHQTDVGENTGRGSLQPGSISARPVPVVTNQHISLELCGRSTELGAGKDRPQESTQCWGPGDRQRAVRGR